MTKQQLFEAIGLAKTAYLEESEGYRGSRNRAWMKWAALAACAVLVVGIAGFAGLIGGMKNGASESADSAACVEMPAAEMPKSEDAGAIEAETEVTDAPAESMLDFSSYAGPIFPLTLAKENDAISAARELRMDFSPFDADENRVRLTDRYVLTNTSDEDVNLTALWPFVSDLRDAGDVNATIRVDGAESDATLYAGGYVGTFSPVQFDEEHENERWNLKYPQSWTEYAALLSDGSYQAEALTGAARLEQTAYVYWFRDTTAPTDAQAATVAATFTRDDTKTQIFTYGINGYGYEPESDNVTYSYFARTYIESEKDALHALIVLGEDIGEITLEGYENGACEAGTELAGVGATIERQEVVLGELIEILCEDYLSSIDSKVYGENENPNRQSIQQLAACTIDLLCTYGPLADAPAERYRDGRLNEIISEAYAVERVCYAAFDLSIPAGDSVTVEVTADKTASFNFFMGDDVETDLYGFEMLCNTGSVLCVTNQTVILELCESAVIADTNLGIPPDVTPLTSELDAACEEYYIKLRRTDAE